MQEMCICQHTWQMWMLLSKSTPGGLALSGLMLQYRHGLQGNKKRRLGDKEHMDVIDEFCAAVQASAPFYPAYQSFCVIRVKVLGVEPLHAYQSFCVCRV